MYISIIYISQRLNVAKYLQNLLSKVNENKNKKSKLMGKNQKHFINLLGKSFYCCCEPTKRISL